MTHSEIRHDRATNLILFAVSVASMIVGWFLFRGMTYGDLISTNEGSASFSMLRVLLSVVLVIMGVIGLAIFIIRAIWMEFSARRRHAGSAEARYIDFES